MRIWKFYIGKFDYDLGFGLLYSSNGINSRNIISYHKEFGFRIFKFIRFNIK